MTGPETVHTPEVTLVTTEMLIDRIQSVLDEFGELGDDIATAEPGTVRQAGFLQHNKDVPYLTSSIVVITEWVNVQVPGCLPAYQIDQRSHVAAPHSTHVIDKYTDDDEVSGIFNYVLPELDQHQFDAYKDPANAQVIKSLFDEQGYAADLERAKHISKRQRRREQKELEKQYLDSGTKAPFARHLAQISLDRRYS